MASKRRAMRHKAAKWLIGEQKLAGVAFAIFASAPFTETLIYDVHVGRGTRTIFVQDYLQLVPEGIILTLTMIVVFLVEPKTAKKHLLDHHSRLSHHLRKHSRYFLYMLVTLLLALILGGSQLIKVFHELNVYVISEIFPIAAEVGLVFVLVHFVAFVIRAYSGLSKHLEEAMRHWEFSLRTSPIFFLFLAVATYFQVGVAGIKPDARLEFYLSIVKDYLLLFIIACMLYLGLFRIAVAGKLVAIFQSIKGLIQFMIICGIIAILAIWADFNSLNPAKQDTLFYYDWQKSVNVLHVYVRDIVLLLMPIAFLLFWTMRQVSTELNLSKDKQRGVPPSE